MVTIMNKLSYFFVSYVIFFFAFSFYYFLSYELTFSSLPTPAFLLLAPATYHLYYKILFFISPIFLSALYIITRKKPILAGVLTYFIFLVYFIIFRNNIYLQYFLDFSAIFMMLTAISALKNPIAKALWAISSFYYLTYPLRFHLLISLVMLSVIASAIELFSNIKQEENKRLPPFS